jgi:hypothetical protein
MIKYKKIISVSVPVIFILLLLIQSPNAEEKILFSNVLPENSYRVKWYKYVYTEAFRRIGKEFEFKQYPMKRGPDLVNMGKLDGELGRVADFNTMYPNLLKVNESLWEVKFVAYTTDKNLKLNKWESLKNKRLRVNYRRGVKKCEEMLNLIVDPLYLDNVTIDLQGLQKLRRKRIDVYVGIESLVDPLLDKHLFSSKYFHKAGVMGGSKIYAFLHRKHSKLAKKLAAVFKAMKKEGLFKEYDLIAHE